jgi:lipopolysaccharide/colanic/teichoic acid biosynthesis glycosyltransferase
LINVLRGELSLVGPRPIPVDEANNTVEQRMTLTIRPGLTGPWRQAADPVQQALLDLYYIRSYSIWLDLQVLVARLRSRLPRGPRPDARFSAGDAALASNGAVVEVGRGR